MSDTLQVILMAGGAAIGVVLAAAIGYWAGLARVFHEHRQKAYMELLPAILKGMFDAPMGGDAFKRADGDAFNRGLLLLWLYAGNRAARKMDKALGTYYNPPKRCADEDPDDFDFRPPRPVRRHPPRNLERQTDCQRSSPHRWRDAWNPDGLGFLLPSLL